MENHSNQGEQSSRESRGEYSPKELSEFLLEIRALIIKAEEEEEKATNVIVGNELTAGEDFRRLGKFRETINEAREEIKKESFLSDGPAMIEMIKRLRNATDGSRFMYESYAGPKTKPE